MNIALSAILLIILLLPGGVAIKAYYTSLIEKQSSLSVPFNDLLIKGLVISFILHATAICVIHLFHAEIALNILYTITSGKDVTISDEILTKYFLQFSLYSIVLIALSWFFAKVFKTIATKYNLNINFHSFRNTNYWFNIFSAKYLEGQDIQGKESDTDLIVLDVLTDTNIIYSGILIDFNYSSVKDELENIILDSTYKRSFEKRDVNENEGHTTGLPSFIPGDAFVIPMNKIRNINVNYIKISDYQDNPAKTVSNSDDYDPIPA